MTAKLSERPGDVLRRVRKRSGRCYELASRVVRDNADDMGLLLVHGRGRHSVDLPFIGHAWIRWRAVVYDPVADVYMSEVQYMGDHDVQVTDVYTRAEACKLLLATGHHGPWTPTDREAIRAEPVAGGS